MYYISKDNGFSEICRITADFLSCCCSPLEVVQLADCDPWASLALDGRCELAVCVSRKPSSCVFSYHTTNYWNFTLIFQTFPSKISVMCRYCLRMIFFFFHLSREVAMLSNCTWEETTLQVAWMTPFCSSICTQTEQGFPQVWLDALQSWSKYF